jgi:hypothetical protein
VRGLTPFITAGAFPVYNTDFNFANTNPAKFSSTDKYLYAVQGGADWSLNRDFHLKLAGALYDFNNIEGRLSNPFTPLTSSDQGNTDDLRPLFAQNGNTYMALPTLYLQPQIITAPFFNSSIMAWRHRSMRSLSPAGRIITISSRSRSR